MDSIYEYVQKNRKLPDVEDHVLQQFLGTCFLKPKRRLRRKTQPPPVADALKACQGTAAVKKEPGVTVKREIDEWPCVYVIQE